MENFVKELNNAEETGNVAFLEKTLTDDFTGIGPRGFILTKKEWLERHTSGDLKYQQLKLNDITLRDYGHTRVLNAIQNTKATYKGYDSSGQDR